MDRGWTGRQASSEERVHLGHALRVWRVKRQMTQEDVALALGTSQKSVCELENGVREPRIFTMINLAKLYQVSIDTLLTVT